MLFAAQQAQYDNKGFTNEINMTYCSAFINFLYFIIIVFVLKNKTGIRKKKPLAPSLSPWGFSFPSVLPWLGLLAATAGP